MDTLAVEDRRNGPVFIHSELDDLGLDPYAFRIYARLARRAGTRRGAFESVDEMARACQMSPRRARQALRDLEESKLVVRQERKGETSVYHLTESKAWRTPARDAAPTPAPGAAPHTPAPHAAPPRHDMPGTPAPGAAEGTPLKEIQRKVPTPPSTSPHDPASQAPADEEEAVEKHKRQPPRHTDKLTALQARHPKVHETLGRLASDRGWRPNQFQTVAVNVLQLADRHGEREVHAALQEILMAGDRITHPVRWLERALADEPDKTDSTKPERVSIRDLLGAS